MILKYRSSQSAGSPSDLQKNAAGSQLSVNTKAPSTVKTDRRVNRAVPDVVTL